MKITKRDFLGSLLYVVAQKRPDNEAAEIIWEVFRSKQKLKHWTAIQNVVKYIKSNSDYEIFISNITERISIFWMHWHQPGL